MGTGQKPLKRLLFYWSLHTRLKPGANEKGENGDAPLFQTSPAAKNNLLPFRGGVDV
jgi:hypothetical protein